MGLEENHHMGVEPKYNVLKRQGYLVFILEKDLVFYKVDDDNKTVTIHGVVDDRQDLKREDREFV